MCEVLNGIFPGESKIVKFDSLEKIYTNDSPK